MFVTIDGLDGSGKTTLVAELEKTAKAKGCNVRTAAFPGTTAIGQSVRSYLLEPNRKRDPITETLLLLGNFREVYADYAASGRDELLIADRFFTSTLGYQGAISPSARDFVQRSVALAFPEAVIDLRLVLDVPYELGQTRITHRKAPDRFDRLDREQFEAIRTEILESAKRDQPTAIVLDNSGTLESAVGRAWDLIVRHPRYPRISSC